MITELTRSYARVELGGRTVKVEGEAYLRGHGSPDFVAYRSTLRAWDDGEVLTDADKERVVEELISSGRHRRITIEVE